MGLLSNLFHSAYIHECIGVLAANNSAFANLAQETCHFYSDLLADYKRDGLTPYQAVISLTQACIDTFTPDEVINPGKRKSLLDMCVDFGMRTLYTAPMSLEGQTFLATFQDAGIKIAYNPYSDDSLQRWQTDKGIGFATRVAT